MPWATATSSTATQSTGHVPGRRRVERAPCVDDAQDVGAQNTNPVFLSNLDQVSVPLSTALLRLAKACGDDDDG